MPLPKEHISVSQINMYLRCPAQYYFRYMQDMVRPPSGALTFGKAFHKAEEHNFRQKIESRQDVKVSEVQEVFAAEIEDSLDATEWGAEKPSVVIDEGVKAIALYHTEIAPRVQPKAVEQEVVVQMDGYKLLGYIDLLDEDEFIIDTKTTKRTPAESVIQNSLQLSAYTFAHKELTGEEPRGVRLDYVVRTKTPKIVQMYGRRSEQEIVRFVNIMGAVVQNIEIGNFYPNPTCSLCTPTMCGYHQICSATF